MDRDSGVSRIIPPQASLDPVTGFVDRRWFGIALTQSRPPPNLDGRAFGVIAIRLDDVACLADDGDPAVRDGLLLIAAEAIQREVGKDDLTARLGHDRLAVLTRGDPAGLARRAAAVRAQLRGSGLAASVEWAVGSEQGGLFAALRSAERRIQASDPPASAAEAAAARAVAVVRDATAASALRGEAAGILMQWHGCTPDRARRELANQAHELGLSLSAMARLLVVVSAGHFAGGPVARGIELDRTLRLATYTAPSQPVWTIEPPNAANVRMALWQPNAPTPPGELRIAGRYQAAAGRRGSGGDWFDGFVLPDGAVGLVLGDVSGHDTLAATVMMQLRSMVRTVACRSDIAPSEVQRQLDSGLVELGSDRVATTVFCWLRADPAGRVVLRWCNAGHLAPVLLTSDGEATVLDTANDLLLGLDGDAARSDLTIALPAGATILLFTDGLIETRTSDVDEGLARLCAAARRLAGADVTTLRDSLLRAMVSADTPDDVTLLAVRATPATAAPGASDQRQGFSRGRDQRRW